MSLFGIFLITPRPLGEPYTSRPKQMRPMSPPTNQPAAFSSHPQPRLYFECRLGGHHTVAAPGIVTVRTEPSQTVGTYCESDRSRRRGHTATLHQRNLTKIMTRILRMHPICISPGLSMVVRQEMAASWGTKRRTYQIHSTIPQSQEQPDLYCTKKKIERFFSITLLFSNSFSSRLCPWTHVARILPGQL